MSSPTYRVLLIEDCEAHAELICRAFEDEGSAFELIALADLASARAWLASYCFDLVLADLLLPDGRSTELLQRGERRAALPIVVLTSHGDENIAVEAIKAGALDYVVKSTDAFERMPHIARRAIREWQHVLERERAEIELRRTEEHLAQAQRVAHIGSWEWSEQDGLRCSDEALRIASLAGPCSLETLLERVLPADREAAEKAVRATLQQGTPLALSLRAAVADGGLRVFQLTAQRCAELAEPGPSSQRGGCIVGTIQDVTEKKQLEQQFLQTQKLEAIGHLASGIAHDFNNLLMGIRGCLTVAMKRSDGDDRARPLLQSALAATQDGAAMTRQLLNFARRPQSEDEPPSEPDALISELRHMLGRLLGERIHIEVALNAASVYAVLGRARLQQIIVNLAVNARDAMPDGGTLRIETGSRSLDRAAAAQLRLSEGEYLELTVSDNGCGMEEATRLRAFDQFFTTKGLGQGTGLGLSMVMSVVSEAGGRIELESELSVGTTFRILLPRAFPAPRAERSVPPPTPGRGETVLVVEDDRLVSQAVEAYLTAARYRVLAAHSVAAAQELARSHGGPVDLVVSDMMLGDGVGPDAVAQVRARWPEVKALYMSAHCAEALLRTEAGDDLCVALQKPFSEAELLASVQRALAERAAKRRSPTDSAGAPAILLVEDSEATRHAMRELLQELGYDVLEAGSAAEARSCFGQQRGRIGVLLTDLGLPDTDGRQLARELQTQDDMLAVVFASGRSVDAPEVAEAIRETHAHFLQKPIDFDELQALIGGMLTPSQARASAPGTG